MSALIVKGMCMAVDCSRRRTYGFTLVESVISIVIIGIAMVTLVSFLYPQIQDSARPHYEVRATTLAHSLMTEIISRGYDHNSDPDGGIVRCGERGVTCTTTFGPDDSSEINSGTRFPQNFNDVDDYIGCWFTNDASKSNCSLAEAGSLTDVLGGDISDKYPNFTANVSVEAGSIDGSDQFKKVTVEIVAGSYGTHSFVAHRGNF